MFCFFKIFSKVCSIFFFHFASSNQNENPTCYLFVLKHKVKNFNIFNIFHKKKEIRR